jgi:hypothetical protein
MLDIARPVVRVARDSPVIGKRIVEWTAVQAQVVGFSLTHGVQKLKARYVGVTLSRD